MKCRTFLASAAALAGGALTMGLPSKIAPSLPESGVFVGTEVESL